MTALLDDELAVNTEGVVCLEGPAVGPDLIGVAIAEGPVTDREWLGKGGGRIPVPWGSVLMFVAADVVAFGSHSRRR